MIDESVMDKIIPIPEEEKEILKIQKELVEKGFIINNFNKGGVFYHLIRISVRIGIEIKQLARSILNSCFIRHAEGESMIVKAADYGRFLREAVKATGYITIYREEFDGTLLISKGHMFKTLPDINGREYKFYAVEDTVIDAGEQVGKVLVEAEKSGTDYNLPAGKITVSMIHLGGVSSVTNEANWLYQEGAEVESIESLRERTMDAFEEAAERTTDAKIKNAAKTVPGVLNVEIDSQHPRGQGTVDIIVTSSAGEATETLLRKVEQAIEYLKGNYDDFLCRSATIVRQDIDLTIYLSKDVSTSGVKEQAEYIIENTLKLTDREDMNCLYLDSIRVALAGGISDYRKSVISKPNNDIELNELTEQLFARYHTVLVIVNYNYLMLDGSWNLDGAQILSGVIRNFKVSVESNIQMLGVDEKLTNLKHIVEHNYWTLNGQVLLDGNRNLDAYRYEEEIL